MKESDGMLSDIFQIKKQATLPLLVKPTFSDVPTLVKGTDRVVPTKIAESTDVYNQIEWEMEHENYNVLTFLDEADIYTVSGGCIISMLARVA